VIAWYICPYKLRPEKGIDGMPTRYCAMDDFTKVIMAEKGDWSEAEIEGDCAIVKVRASEDTIKLLDEEFQRLPADKPVEIRTLLGVSCTRRLDPEYDARTDKVTMTGAVHAARTLESVDKAVPDEVVGGIR